MPMRFPINFYFHCMQKKFRIPPKKRTFASLIFPLMIEQIVTEKVTEAVKAMYQLDATPSQIQLQNTRKEFEGDITLVVFPFTKVSRKSPEATASEIGEYIKANLSQVENFNVIKGFLNLSINKEYWINFLSGNYVIEKFGFQETRNNQPVVVEYSSPNTNKPLHLGHIRNNLLGFSLSRILQAAGHNVVKVNLVNDRGIHICKSMLAWQRWGNGETPESSGLKGDHLVGKYYVVFDKYFKEEIAALVAEGMDVEEASKKAPLILEAQQILQKWEAGDKEVISLWEMMNGWVYDGFAKTYQTLGIEFDKTYYESQTYLLGKKLVEEGVQKGVYTRRDDGSVWIDLSADGMDEKLLLRSDGTSVYMTQDLGTAMQRYEEYNPEQLIYVVGNEQEYHFNVLKVVLRHLGCTWAESIYHLSYGMVELPAGKMKSREGTVVDADDLMQEMFDTSEAMARELGKIETFDNEEARNLYRTIGLGALKYFILKVDPKKNMMFNPAESVDFNGNTGPFIQYTYARIKSVLRKAAEAGYEVSFSASNPVELLKEEKELLKKLHDFPLIVLQAADMHSPAVIANYAFELASEYNRFYHEITILKEENLLSRGLRLSLSQFTAKVIANALWMLGIEVPERM
jgi:arginyl-tRNA synthetase